MATGGVSDIERGTDETFDILCSVCKGKNKNTEAEKFCYDCHDYYCSTCVKFHADIPVLRNHQILDKAQFQLGSSVKSLIVPTERCKVHMHKPVDMYCRNHDVVACSACMLVEHSVCKDKFYVPEYIKNSNNIPASTETAEQLCTIANQLSLLQNTFITEKEKLKGSKEKSLKQIKTFRKEINQRLNDFEKRTIQGLDRRYQSLHDKIKSELKELQTAATKVKAAQDDLKYAGGNTAQRFVSVKTANAVVAHAQEKTDKLKSQLFSTEVSFEANQKLQSLLNDIQVLGDITTTDRPLSQPTGHVSVKQEGNRQTSQKTDKRMSMTSLFKIDGSKKYNMKVKSDRLTGHILSACILDDGTIILSDINNKRLKCADPDTFIVTDFCDVPMFPHQVCAVSKTEVAVGCGSGQLIQFVSVGRKMVKTRQIKTGYFCSGLAYADRKLFVIGDDSVYVHTVSGEKLQQFVLGDIGESRLAVSSDNMNIYVSSVKKGLIILDRNDSSIEGFSGEKLNDVCLHNSGNVLVCGRDSRNILQFNPDGTLIGEVLKSDSFCNALCCDKNKSRLIVGNENCEIEVYDIVV